MEENVMITLSAKQIIDGNEDHFELITRGSFVERNGKFYASYKGSEITGYDQTTTTLKMNQNSVSMIRFEKEGGATQMIFELNRPYTSVYQTPFGTMTMDILTNLIHVDVDQNGGDVELDYFIQTGGEDPVRNNLRLNIRKVEQS